MLRALAILVAEVAPEDVDAVKAAVAAAAEASDVTVVGSVLAEPEFRYGDMRISMEEALAAWTGTLEKGIPHQSDGR